MVITKSIMIHDSDSVESNFGDFIIHQVHSRHCQTLNRNAVCSPREREIWFVLMRRQQALTRLLPSRHLPSSCLDLSNLAKGHQAGPQSL
jgi:hypothetical protein